MSFATDFNGIPVFDGTGAVLWEHPGGGVCDVGGTLYTVNGAGQPFDTDGTTPIAQLAMGTRVAQLIQLTARGTRTARQPRRFARTPA